jgi:hypothetical protein
MADVYGLKEKRLRFMKLAGVNGEIRRLKNRFLQDRAGHKPFIPPDLSSLSPRALDILIGLFGQHGEARTILDLDRRILDLDHDEFQAFLSERIDSTGARNNLYALLLGDGESMRSIISRQVPYLEKYIPVMRIIDEMAARNLGLRDEQAVTLEHIIVNFDEIKLNLSRDTALYKRFIRDLRPLYHEQSNLSIIGYGEISTVMEISKGGFLDSGNRHLPPKDQEWIWKKMPPFPSLEEALSFEKLYQEYRRIIVEEVGIDVPEQRIACFPFKDQYMVYAGQKRIDPSRVCHHLIRNLDHGEAITLFRLLLTKFGLLHSFNHSEGTVRIGFDGQLSNWVHIPGKKSRGSISADDDLFYVDTSSPLIRINGVEQLNVELFIKNAPSFLRYLLKKLFLQEVVDRYYDLRSVLIDLIGNLHKEQRSDLIDDYIDLANEFIREKNMGPELTRKEIDTYYSRDANIWRFYQTARRIDKFFIEKILRKRYNLRLPGKVER